MFAIERRNNIIALLNEKRSLLVQEMAANLCVTEETIRRDLKELEGLGLLIRTHGGAVLVDESKAEVSLALREGINIAGKDLIGKAAARMVNDGDTIILDASTSALFVAKHLKDKQAITVITNAEKVVFELSGLDEVTIISTGGTLRHKSLSYVGRAAEDALSKYYANKVFFSCKGLALNRGLTDSNEQEAEIRRTMMKNSEQTIFLCDYTKFGKVGYVNTASFEDIDMILVDQPLPEGWQFQIEKLGVKILILGESSV
jgi:DeoR/GlpR family transcriptional regulator of sugar metabolism